jgi:uncharacterized membrane protein
MHIDYLAYKYAHIFLAIVALGTSASLAMLLEFFVDDPSHGAYVLRMVRKLLYFVVVPGYVLMLATGIWMGHLAALLDAHWTEAAMNLWGIGALFIALSLILLHKQVVLLESAGAESRAYRRIALLSRLSGGATGLVIVVILYFMVFKPVY